MFRIHVLETFDIYISGQLFAWTAFLLDSLLNGPHFREKYYLLGTSPKLIQLEVCFDGSSHDQVPVSVQDSGIVEV